MARVQLYDRQPLQTRAAPTVQQQGVSPDAFGAGLGESIQRTAGIIERDFIEPERQKANLAAINDAQAQIDRRANELTLEYQKTKGHDALKASADVIKSFNDHAQSVISSTLTTPEQKAAVQQWYTKRSVHFDASVNEYASRQVEEQARFDLAARLESSKNRAVLGAMTGSDLEVRDSATDAMAAQFEYNQANNITGEREKALNTAAYSDFWSSVVNAQLAAQNYLAAQKTFEEHKSGMDAKTVTALTKATERGTLTGEAQRKVDEITRVDDKSLGDALEEARAIKDPVLRDEVEGRVVRHYSLKERAYQADQDKLFDDIYRLAEQSPLGLDGVSPSMLSELQPRLQRQLQEWSNRRAKGQPLSWQDSLSNFMQWEATLATEEGRQKFMATPPSVWMTTMNETDARRLVSMVQQGKKDPAVFDGIVSQKQIIDRSFRAFTKTEPSDGKSGKPNEAYVEWTNAVNTRLRSLVTRPDGTVRKVTDEDVQKAVDQLISEKVTVPGSFFFGVGGRENVPYYSLTPEQRASAIVPDLQDGQRVAMRKKLIERGIPNPNQFQIEHAAALLRANDQKAYEEFLNANRSK